MAGVEIDLAPAKRCDLATPETAEDGKHGWDEHAVATQALQQFCGLADVVGIHLAALDLGGLHRVGRIAGQQLPSKGLL